MKHENLGLMVTVDRQFDAEELVPSVEAVGLTECLTLKISNIILGRVAVAADYSQVVDSLTQMPEVARVEPEPEHYALPDGL